MSPDIPNTPAPYLNFDIQGFAPMGIKYDVFMQLSHLSDEVLAHELGHNCGLNHCQTIPANTDRVMYYSGNANTRERLAKGEVSAYE